jgi:hypothetical protein
VAVAISRWTDEAQMQKVFDNVHFDLVNALYDRNHLPIYPNGRREMGGRPPSPPPSSQKSEGRGGEEAGAEAMEHEEDQHEVIKIIIIIIIIMINMLMPAPMIVLHM